MPPSYPLWECPSKASSQLMSTQDQGSFQPAGRRVEPSSVCHCVPRLKKKKTLSHSLFSVFCTDWQLRCWLPVTSAGWLVIGCP